MTDSEIIGAFAELLNRRDGVFVRGKFIPCEEDITHLYLDKHTAYELVCDEAGKLVEINEVV